MTYIALGWKRCRYHGRHTQFVEVLPNTGTSSRNQSILELTGLTNRIVRDLNDFSYIDQEIDFKEANEKIGISRIESHSDFRGNANRADWNLTVRIVEDERMNIAIISHSAGGGGAERVAVNLANHLLNENEVFFCAVHSDRREYYLDPKVQYDYIGTERSGFRGQLSIAINLRKYIKKNNIEVMISLDISVEGIFLIGNKKLFKIYSLRNDPTKVFNSGLKKILSNLVYWDADKIVFQTPDARDYFCQKIREHGVLIPNPVKSGLPYWNEENHRKEVVAACRLAKQKNLFMLLDAYRIVWEKRQDYKLSIYGEGELKEALVRYAEQLGISEAVKFHGFSSEIHKIMAGSAIYVSSSDYEGISNSMLEALAIGIPAICTDCPVGGARMYIRDGENGYLIPVGDADVMADRMLALMEDKKLGESFSKESVKIREELTDDRIFGMWKALLVR